MSTKASCGNCGIKVDTPAELDRHECSKKQMIRCGHCEGMYSLNKIDDHACYPAKGKDMNINKEDPINPSHYKTNNAPCASCGSPIECIAISRWFNFNLGNVIKYIWRFGKKGHDLEQLKKAHWYLRDEIRKYESDFDANK